MQRAVNSCKQNNEFGLYIDPTISKIFRANECNLIQSFNYFFSYKKFDNSKIEKAVLK